MSSRKGQQQRRSYYRTLGLRFDRQDDGTVRVRTVRPSNFYHLAYATDAELVDIGTIRYRCIPIDDPRIMRAGRMGWRWLAYTPDGKPSVITKTRRQAAEMLLAVWKGAQR